MNSISRQAETLFVRLIMKADDYGNYSANPKLIRSQCFPLLVDSIREADISRWIAECEKAGMIALYQVEEKQLVHIVNFAQRLRHAKPKFPAFSPQSAASRGELPQVAARRDVDIDTDDDVDTEEIKKPSPRGDAVGFDEFWIAYPRKVGKADAKKAWIKTKSERPDLQNILKAIRKQCQSQEWQKERGSFIPHPSTWLNQGRWDDGGLDMDALRGRTSSKSILAAAIALPEINEDDAFAWLKENYDTIEHIPVENYRKKFSDWPEQAKESYIKTLK